MHRYVTVASYSLALLPTAIDVYSVKFQFRNIEGTLAVVTEEKNGGVVEKRNKKKVRLLIWPHRLQSSRIYTFRYLPPSVRSVRLFD